MADFGTPVAANINVNPNQGLQTLSSLLGIKQQQQALQGQQAQVQQEQQTAQQRSGIANWMQHFDMAQHVGPDGTLDLDQVLTDPKMRAAAGDQYPALIDQFLKIKNSQLAAKQALVGLNSTAREAFQQQLGGLRTDSDVLADNDQGRQKVQESIGQFAAQGPDEARIANIYGNVFAHTPKGQLVNNLSIAQLQAQAASAQSTSQAPQMLDTGGGFKNINPQAAGGNLSGQAPIAKTIPPGITGFTDAAGNPRVFNQQNPGASVIPGQGQGLGGGGGAGGGAAPAPIRPPTNIPGQADLNANIESARQASANVGTNSAINKRILSLVKDTSTGPGTNFLHQAAAAAGLSTGSSYQELGAFLDRQAAQAQESMGVPHTNAGLETAKQFTGNTQLDNQVIKDKTNFAEALNTASGAYRAGMERVLGNPQSPDYAGYQKYRAAWAQNFSPDVFAYENAVKNGDKDEQRRIEQDEGRKGMAELRQKRQALMGLVNG